jgi:hypothetical protein
MSFGKPKPIPSAEFVPWTAVHFQSQEIRDRFLCVAATLSARDVEVEPMLDEIRSALVRWRPGNLLALNDIAYAHGGRIVVMQRGGAQPSRAHDYGVHASK